MIDEQRIADLERQVRELNRTVVGIQNALRSASRYENENPQKQLEGAQILLGKAADYEPRKQARGRR